MTSSLDLRSAIPSGHFLCLENQRMLNVPNILRMIDKVEDKIAKGKTTSKELCKIGT